MFQKTLNKQFDKEREEIIANHKLEIDNLEVDFREKLIHEKNYIEE